MPNNDLAALSAAATWCGKKPLVLECVEGGIWQLRLIFGEGDDACRAMRQWSDEYRAGRLVQIDGGMRERVARAIDHELVWSVETDVLASSLTREEQLKVADAVIAAMGGAK